MSGKYAFTMWTAFYGKVARRRIESHFARIDDNACVEVIPGNEDGSFIGEPFTGYVDVTHLDYSGSYEGYATSG
jgi:hypothetical protein